MEQVDATDIQQPSPATRTFRVEHEDVGNLDQVLRGYYLGQIQQIDNRKDRLLARKLIENHLILPKSRQRTSKDAAYIREIVGIEVDLLAQLVESRLIRRVNKGGKTPIYEVSHDTLVEPILAERQRREAIGLFLRQYGRWFLLLLLLLFAFGMFFENSFDLVDDSFTLAPAPPDSVSLEAINGIVAGRGTQRQVLLVPFPGVNDFHPNDSLTLSVAVNVTAHPQLENMTGGDTISVDLGALALNLPIQNVERLLATQRDTAIPLHTTVPIGGRGEEEELMAEVAGTALLRLLPETSASLQTRGGLGVPGAGLRLQEEVVIQASLGHQTVQAAQQATSISLDTVVNLADLIQGDPLARDLLQGKSIRLTYQVDIDPPPQQQEGVEYVPVAGIEVQYQDGTRRFIPSAPGSADQPVTHTVQSGETLYKISKLYGVPPEDIRRLNQMQGNIIKVGQLLRIR